MIVLILALNGFLAAEDFFKIKDRILTQSWLKLLAFYITPQLSISNLGYSSNIYSYKENVEPDWTADLGIRFTVSTILANRFIIQLHEYPYYTFYSKNKQEEAFNNALNLYVHSYLGRLNFTYTYTNKHLRDRPNIEFGRNLTRKIEGNRISFDLGRHDSLYISVYGGNLTTNYENVNYLNNANISELFDTDAIEAGFAINKIIFSRTIFSLNLDYRDWNFIYSSDRNRIERMLSAGIRFPEISSIKGAIKFGIKSYLAVNYENSAYEKPFGSGDIQIRIFRRFRIELEYLVDNFYSFFSRELYFDEVSAGIGFQYYLNRIIKLGYKYKAGNMNFKYVSSDELYRKDTYYSSIFILGIRLQKNTGLGLTYTIFNAESSILPRKYNFIGGFITYDF